MFNISTNGIVRTVLISSFAVALLIGAGGAYFVLHERAVQRTAAEAGRLLGVATAVRGYTDQHIAPLLRMDDKLFHAETVPAFAAQTVYRTVQGNYPGYTYREPALKPTNPNDLPTPIEVELLNKFRANPELKELTGVRDDAKGSVYYLARPIKAQESCLVCHDTPQRAPPAMVAKYGPNNGFGWQLNEVVALQSLSVPAAEELRETGEIAMLLAGGLLLVFLATYFALTLSIESLVVRPLRSLAQAAEAASMGNDASAALPASGAQEIRSIAAAIERLRTSLSKALKRLADDASAGKS
jgi:methyl-accepting chemotaxis protein